MKKVKMRLPLGHIEHIGRCTIKKVCEYGYKYRVFVGSSVHKFATIRLARNFAINDFHQNASC